MADTTSLTLGNIRTARKRANHALGILHDMDDAITERGGDDDAAPELRQIRKVKADLLVILAELYPEPKTKGGKS